MVSRKGRSVLIQCDDDRHNKENVVDFGRLKVVDC